MRFDSCKEGSPLTMLTLSFIRKLYSEPICLPVILQIPKFYPEALASQGCKTI